MQAYFRLLIVIEQELQRTVSLYVSRQSAAPLQTIAESSRNDFHGDYSSGTHQGHYNHNDPTLGRGNYVSNNNGNNSTGNGKIELSEMDQTNGLTLIRLHAWLQAPLDK